MTEEELRQLISEQTWTFAKSMPGIPHWYVVRKTFKRPELFEPFVLYIRKFGYQQQFGRKTYTYLELDGFNYWTMGYPAEETTIINRAQVVTKRDLTVKTL